MNAFRHEGAREFILTQADVRDRRVARPGGLNAPRTFYKTSIFLFQDDNSLAIRRVMQCGNRVHKAFFGGFNRFP
jgi:hypothetical protein